MTRVFIDTTASLPIPPPRSKPARDDSVSSRDDFSTMVDDNAPRPAEPGQAKATDQRGSSVPATKPPADQPKDSSETPTPPAEASTTPVVVTGIVTPDPDAVKPADADKTPGAEILPDAAALDAAASQIAPVATPAAAIAAVTVPQIIAPQIVIPQIIVAPIATLAAPSASTVEAGPLSIAAAAIATTAATVEATQPQKKTVTDKATMDKATPDKATPGLATPEPAPTSDPAAVAISDPAVTPIVAAASAEPKLTSKVAAAPLDATRDRAVADGGTPDTPEQAAAISTAQIAPPTQPVPTSAAPDAAPKADATPAASPDATPAIAVSAPIPHEHRSVAAQTSIADGTSPTPTLAQPIAHHPAPTSVVPPQVSIVASQTAPVPLSGLAMHIAATANGGKTSFDIRLDPAELGRIDVRLDVDRHGNVTSHLTVEKPETLAMLRQDAPQLQRALSDAGLQTSDKSLQFNLSDQSLSGQNNNPNKNPDDNRRGMQRLVIAEDENLSIASAGRSYGRMLSSSSGVDIRI